MMEYLIPIASFFFGTAIGAGVMSLFAASRIAGLNSLNAAHLSTIRDYGREIGELRAERFRRDKQRQAALAKAQAANRARHLAKINSKQPGAGAAAKTER